MLYLYLCLEFINCHKFYTEEVDDIFPYILARTGFLSVTRSEAAISYYTRVSKRRFGCAFYA